MYFVTVPPPAEIRDPLNDKSPVLETMPFAKTIRVALGSLLQKQVLDTMQLLDLRDKFDGATVGSVVELTEPEHKALAGELAKPTGLTPAFILGGGETHLRAILKASDKRPEAGN